MYNSVNEDYNIGYDIYFSMSRYVIRGLHV